MERKKIVSILLAGALILSMTACGNEAEDKTNEDANNNKEEQNNSEDNENAEGGDTESDWAGETVTIFWPESDSTQVDVMNNYIQPALEEAFPEVTFEYTPLAGDNPIMTLSATGDLPDIYYNGGSSVDATIAAGDTLDLVPYLEEGWLEENYANPDMLYNGDAVYFLAVGQNAYYTPVFYYNTALFEENGLEEPENIDDLITICQTFVDKGITPITTTAFMSEYSLLDGLIASVAPDSLMGLHTRENDWNDEGVKEALGYFDELKTMGAFAPDIVNKDDATALAEFASGNTAMWLTYSWCNYDVTEENLGFVPGAFNFPAPENGDYIQLMFEPRPGNGGGYTGNAHSEHPELIAKVLQVMAEAEATRHNNEGINTNFIVDNPAEPTNPLEVERMEAYNNAKYVESVLGQSSMGGVVLAEFATLYSALISDDPGYLSANFIEEFTPIWEANTYAPD